MNYTKHSLECKLQGEIYIRKILMLLAILLGLLVKLPATILIISGVVTMIWFINIIGEVAVLIYEHHKKSRLWRVILWKYMYSLEINI